MNISSLQTWPSNANLTSALPFQSIINVVSRTDFPDNYIRSWDENEMLCKDQFAYSSLVPFSHHLSLLSLSTLPTNEKVTSVLLFMSYLIFPENPFLSQSCRISGRCLIVTFVLLYSFPWSLSAVVYIRTPLYESTSLRKSFSFSKK